MQSLMKKKKKGGTSTLNKYKNYASNCNSAQIWFGDGEIRLFIRGCTQKSLRLQKKNNQLLEKEVKNIVKGYIGMKPGQGGREGGRELISRVSNNNNNGKYKLTIVSVDV